MIMIKTRPSWRKSSYSNSNSNCVEVGQRGEQIAVRDSKDTGGPKLPVTPEAWRSFTARMKNGS
jgi:uncharacterized protein DUF397